MTDTTKRTMTVVEAADALGIGKSTLYRQIELGSFPHLRIGGRIVIPVAVIERMLDGAGELVSA
jgi:excisionase family DNA binding protein